MKLTLQAGQAKLTQEARRLQEINLQQLNQIFTGTGIEGLLEELSIKPESSNLPDSSVNAQTDSKSIESWQF